MSFDRRLFLKGAGGATLGLYLLPACESNEITPKNLGAVFPFLLPVDPSNNRMNRIPGSYFVQFGASTSVVGFQYEDVAVFSNEQWSMTVDGLVTQTLDLGYDDVLAKAGAGEDTKIVSTMRCVIDNTGVPGLIGTTVWTGVPVRSFLEEAGVDLAATREGLAIKPWILPAPEGPPP
ncbi:MAG: molybdopterin-dependent oxidoreductase [Myxococcales bacterium]|nr:molybdopterin-dependent oxidoreductase [Myxococcales bacterium]